MFASIRSRLLWLVALLAACVVAVACFAGLTMLRLGQRTHMMLNHRLPIARCAMESRNALSTSETTLGRLVDRRDEGPGSGREPNDLAALQASFDADMEAFSTCLSMIVWGSAGPGKPPHRTRIWTWPSSRDAVPPAAPAMRQLGAEVMIYHQAYVRAAREAMGAAAAAAAADSAAQADARHAMDASIQRARYFASMAQGLLARLVNDVQQSVDQVSDDVQQLRLGALRTLVYVSIAMVAASFALGALLAERIVRPILELHAGASIIGAGDFDHRVGTQATDEIGRLSRAFDRMVENIRSVTASRDQLGAEIRERERAQSELRGAMLQLRDSNQDLEQFAFAASHDLQEPLRKIQTFGGLLVSEYGGDLCDEAKDYVDRMTKAAARMQTLIDGLLTYSRIATRAAPFKPVDLNEVVKGVMNDLEDRIRRTGGRVTAGPLPTIEADATQMRQLLQNLIGNALKFHKPGVPPEVEVRALPVTAEAQAAICRIAVTDHGIGFDIKQRERIFELFQRLHGRGEYEGAGIGLAVCRKIVLRHGGSIDVQSTPGEGATFEVTLPIRQPQPAEEGPKRES